MPSPEGNPIGLYSWSCAAPKNRDYDVVTFSEGGALRARLVKIGNSRGLRLAKPLLEQVGLSDEVDIQAGPGVLTIRPVARPRAGWAEAAAAAPPQGLLDGPSATRFDDEEWHW